MSGNAAGNASQATDYSGVGRNIFAFLRRRIWLPKLIYSAVPYFYVAAGFAALLATFYIAEWFWVLPHYLLFSFASMHIGFIVFRRRRERRESQRGEPEALQPKSLT
jgi:hypothetical protein